MKLPVKKTTTFVSLCISMLVTFALGAFIVMSTQSVEAQTGGGRLITVHDRGVETSFITNKATIREALVEQGVRLDIKDAVEPSLDETLVAHDYQVNIYRARPVTVVDGAIRERIVTPYQTAERIAKDAGIILYAEDTTTLKQSSDIVGSGAGLELVIDRATLVSLDLYGKETLIRTQASTVGAMLKEKHIELGKDSRVSVGLDAPISQGMSLRVWLEGRQTITADEDVAFTVEQIKDADQPIGYKQVQLAGQNGKRTVTYEIIIENGIEVGRTEIASLVLQEAVTQVEVIGTKPKTLPYTGGGTKTEWLAASNIAEQNWGYADFMVMKESGWNPNAVNKSSGACGLAQALPCSKLGSQWNNPVVALNWMDSYVTGRYGGWQQAYNFWVANHWY